jgi:hypothetical protein
MVHGLHRRALLAVAVALTLGSLVGCGGRAGSVTAVGGSAPSSAASGTQGATSSAQASATATSTSKTVSPKKRLSTSDTKAIDAELAAIQSELDRMSVPSDSDFGGISSGLK